MRVQYHNVQIFADHITSFKETSKDTDSGELKYMTQSEREVINFDKVKSAYIKDMKLAVTPCSSDALYIDQNGIYYFVEFKNGAMNKSKVFNVYNKIYDTLLIFNDIIGENISFCRQNVVFLLVYNESKNSSGEEREDSAKAAIGKYFARKAQKRYIRFGLEKFKTIYFRDVYTYTEKEFEQEFLPRQQEV